MDVDSQIRRACRLSPDIDPSMNDRVEENHPSSICARAPSRSAEVEEGPQAHNCADGLSRLLPGLEELGGD